MAREGNASPRIRIELNGGQRFLAIRWRCHCRRCLGFTVPRYVISYPAQTRLWSTAPVVVIQRQTATASGEDQHPGGDQLMANVCGRPGVPRSRGDPSGLGQDVVSAIGMSRSSSIDSARLRRSAA